MYQVYGCGHVCGMEIPIYNYVKQWRYIILGTVSSQHATGAVLSWFDEQGREFPSWKSNTNNYKPVTLLFGVSKIFEKIELKHLFNKLRSINFISPHQLDFQLGFSVVNQLSSFYHIFCDERDKKKDVQDI